MLNPSTDKVTPAVKRRPVSLLSGPADEEDVPALEVEAGVDGVGGALGCAAGCGSWPQAQPTLKTRHANCKPAIFFKQSSR